MAEASPALPLRQGGPGRLRRRVLAAVLALASVAGLARLGLAALPARWNPFAPLDLRAEPNLLTRYKLSRLERDAEGCFAALRGSGLRHERVPDLPSGNGCGLANAVRVSRTEVGFNAGFTATCALAAAWAMFETHALQPAAERHFGQRVVRVIHRGAHVCRNIARKPDRRRSEHATANAIDIAGFVLADGTQVSVRRDWRGEGKAAAFLRDVHAGACRFFDVTLGPDFNAMHHNHFHFDRGPFRACR